MKPNGGVSWLVLVLLASVCQGKEAQLRLPAVFSDHMVLQRGRPIPIWGTAGPGSAVEVTMGRETARTHAAMDGRWMVRLRPRAASAEPTNVIVSDGSETKEFNDVIVGEVWLASGQSNMQFPVRSAEGGAAAIASSNVPAIRIFAMNAIPPPAGAFSDSLTAALRAGEYFVADGWRRAEPGSVSEVSAVAWFFADRLHEALRVPVGIVVNAVGGSPIEAWYDVAPDSAWPDLPWVHPFVRDRVRDNLPNAADRAEIHPFAPGYLFRNGIVPLAPYSLRGVIWYQGESNANDPARYAESFAALVSSWRRVFALTSLPFGFVQLPGIAPRREFPGDDWPAFRDMQRKLLQIPRTGMAVTIDLGDAGNVHPKRKREVGERLAGWALADVYHQGGAGSGPLPQSATVRGESVTVRFRSADGLEVKDGSALTGFELAAGDRVFRFSQGRVLGRKVVVKASGVANPRWVRYGWSFFPDPPLRLVDAAGVPASPFELKVSE